MLRIGLTGGIATGKSTVATILSEDFGVPVVDADHIARAIVAPNQPALLEIIEAFGEEMRLKNGHLNRALLGQCVMHDKDKRKALEAITHPRIFEGIRNALEFHQESGSSVAVVEAALMVETGSYRAYDKLIVVSSSTELQLQRLCYRDGHTAENATAWINAQLPLTEKEAVADLVIRNEGNREQLREAVHQGWSRLVVNRGSQ